MTTRPDVDRTIQAFLDEGLTELPDRSFDTVRRDIHRTRQRVVIGPWREPDMTTLARVAIATAAVVVAAVAWVNLGPRQGTVGTGPTPSPSPSASPSVAPSSSPSPSAVAGIPLGSIPGGTYRLDQDGYPTLDPARIVMTVPAGWHSSNGILFKGSGEVDGVTVGPWEVIGTAADPCTNHTLKQPTPTAGAMGIEALAEALSTQPKTTAKPPAPVTVDGYQGKLVEVTVAKSVDITKCLDGTFLVWASPGGDFRYVQGNEETNRIWILDVGGKRFTFISRIPKGTSDADIAEVDAMVASIQLEPVP